MKIKNETGEIFLQNLEEPIGPKLTRKKFLACALSQNSEMCMQNEPWCSYRLSPVEVADTKFYIVLQFHSQKLQQVSLSDGNQRFGSSWDDVTEEKLKQQKEQHDKWLKNWNFLTDRHSWGQVTNSIDPHDNSSSIILRYA